MTEDPAHGGCPVFVVSARPTVVESTHVPPLAGPLRTRHVRVAAQAWRRSDCWGCSWHATRCASSSSHLARIATIRKARFAPFRDSFSIDVEGRQEMVAQGDILDHEYDILREDEAVARVSKHRFALSDTYGIEVAPGEDEGLVLAVAGRTRRDGPRFGLSGPVGGSFGTASHGAHSYALRDVSRALL